jgi:hypothetical protein
MNEYAEKRDFHRMGINCPAQIRIHGMDETTDSIIKNLSASGLLILSQQEISPGTQLLVHIRPTNNITPPLLASASVLRSQPAEEGGYEVACSIEKILGEEDTGQDFP